MKDLLTDAQLPGWSWTGINHPSHVIIFSGLVDAVGLDRGENRSIRDILEQEGYTQVWSRWNGIDWAEDEDSKGNLHVWAKTNVDTLPNNIAKHVDDL